MHTSRRVASGFPVHQHACCDGTLAQHRIQEFLGREVRGHSGFTHGDHIYWTVDGAHYGIQLRKDGLPLVATFKIDTVSSTSKYYKVHNVHDD